jgi:hypothetical protein
LRALANEVPEVEILRAAMVDPDEQPTATAFRCCIDQPDLLRVGAGLIDQAFGQPDCLHRGCSRVAAVL